MKLPDGAKVAVWVILNVENWLLESPARSILPAPEGAKGSIDVPNFAWHEYGLRVGFWRMREIMAKHDVAPTVALNASVCEAYPSVAQTCKEEGWEIMGHGYRQRALPVLDDEEGEIRRTTSEIERFFGRGPTGWLSPGLAETKETLRLLIENGYQYVCDWVNDDQPYEIQLNGKKLYSIPYTLELNDIILFALQHFTADEFYLRAKAQLDELLLEGSETPRVMAIAVHPYLSGVPHRAKVFEQVLRYVKSRQGVWLTNGEGILNAYKQSLTL